ncbi:hypothetical protein, partial [Streptomyces nanshensis]|uniref:hypothetical protein n=1 Tax=Streptomyces nanshensis TaxID=518642 RepID=UPI00114D2F1E
MTAFESSFGELVVIGAHSRCADCDQAPVYVVGEEAVHVQSPCPFPDGITMQITLEVPSGQMIV